VTAATFGPAEDREQAADRMRAITAGLQAAGLDARVHDTRGVQDIAATLHRPGGKDIAVTVDEDGYTGLAYWNDPGATPAKIVAVITAALAAITGPP
jgi:hypothetical protein